MGTRTFRTIHSLKRYISGSGDSHSNIKGISIVEMIMSLLVIGFVSALTLPALVAQVTGCSIEGNAREISEALMVARLRAVETQMPHRLKFDLSSSPQKFIIQRGVTSRGATTWVDDVTIQEMKENVMINRVDDEKGTGRKSGIGSIEFGPMGNPTKGVVYLENSEGKKCTITLDVATGKVTSING